MYLYRCTKCGSELDVLRNIREHDLLPTPEEVATVPPGCEGHEWKRKIGMASIHFMGRGWSPDGYQK